jgi:thiol-disulfide isomerase/thioredoxin
MSAKDPSSIGAAKKPGKGVKKKRGKNFLWPIPVAKREYYECMAGILMAILSVSVALQPLPRFALRDTGGVVHHEDEWSKSRAVVVFFTTTDCPISNSYVPEMNRIRAEYGNRGVAFYAVQADITIRDGEVRKHAIEFGFAFPVLFDPKQMLVRLAGATATPEAAVLSNDGAVLYLGRIDNRIVDFDKRRPVATESDLRNALDAVLAAQPVPHPKTEVTGCAINLVNPEKER